MARQKYNPAYHNNVPRNFRYMWKDEFPDTALNLTDEQVWDIFTEWATAEASDDIFPNIESRYDASVLNALVEANGGAK